MNKSDNESSVGHTTGNQRGRVHITEYADFECPFCGKAYYIIDRLQKEGRDLFSYTFRNFPLIDVHPNALLAALSAEAAGRQGKFWQMHSKLFENQSLLGQEYIMAYADEIGLDMKKLLRDMESEDLVAQLEQEIASGEEAGVESTPSFFIDGTAYTGPYDYGILSLVIDQLAAGNDYERVEYDHAISHSKR